MTYVSTLHMTTLWSRESLLQGSSFMDGGWLSTVGLAGWALLSMGVIRGWGVVIRGWVLSSMGGWRSFMMGGCRSWVGDGRLWWGRVIRGWGVVVHGGGVLSLMCGGCCRLWMVICGCLCVGHGHP